MNVNRFLASLKTNIFYNEKGNQTYYLRVEAVPCFDWISMVVHLGAPAA
jgi:hypothetical protein